MYWQKVVVDRKLTTVGCDSNSKDSIISRVRQQCTAVEVAIGDTDKGTGGSAGSPEGGVVLLSRHADKGTYGSAESLDLLQVE